MAIGQMLTAATNMATLIASWFANCEQMRCVAPGWARRDCYLAGWLLEVEAEAEAENCLELGSLGMRELGLYLSVLSERLIQVLF